MSRLTPALFTIGMLVPLAVFAQVPPESYRVESIPTPEGIAPEVSALCFSAEGTLFAAFQRGTLWRRSQDGAWSLFASGLHVPLGILPGDNNSEFFVAQMPELTRIVDTDADGKADLYQTVCDRWGLSGNYHEFVSNPVRDEEGAFYLALGCASSSGQVREPVRGRRLDFATVGNRYGHLSPVSYRGWVVKISPDGVMTPVASGLRQPNGLLRMPDGNLFVVDNQGDWVGTSPLHHVTEGAFHGHPASLAWEPGISGNPFAMDRNVLDRRRKPAAILFPQDDLAGSTAGLVLDSTEGRFGPYSGQLFVAEWSHPRIHRVFLEKVGGTFQGACFSFLEKDGLRRGNQRLAFAPDGSLWVAQTSRVWGGTGDGLQRVCFLGKIPFDILAMRLTSRGFELEFTRAVERSTISAATLPLRRYRYLYHPQYGSPKTDIAEVAVESLELSEDGRNVSLGLSDLRAGFLYELRPHGVKSVRGEALATRIAAYTLNTLRESR